MFKDEHKREVWDTLRQHDLRALSRLLPDSLVESAAAEAGVKVGRGPLNLVTQTWLALLGALETTKNFTGVLQLTLKLMQDAGTWRGEPSACLSPRGPARGKSQRRGRGRKGSGKGREQARKGRVKSKHDPRGGDPNLVSEEAFQQARRRMPRGFWVALILMIGRCFEQKHGALVRWKRRFRLLALDGTTINLPGWKRLAEHFGTARNQRRGARRQTQARMVMLQFPLTRMPWRYELTTMKEGERTVAGRMLGQLRANDLVLMDRGFFSFGLFCQVQERRAFFAVRLMAGVKLKHVKHLGRKDRLAEWTPSDRRRWKGLPESIRLRVIDYQIKGFRPSAIVTNVTDPRAISRDEWVRLTTQSDPGRRLDPGLYHRRWEIETTFFELKVSQGMEGGLRGRTPDCIAYEVAGHVTLYLLTRWLMVEAAVDSGKDPLRLSFTGALRELEELRPVLVTAAPRRVREYLLPLLLLRIASHDVPWRPGRHDPRPGDTKTKYKGRGHYRKPSKLAVGET